MTEIEPTEKRGVLQQHRERTATEPEYRDAAMTAPSITDKTGISAKILPGTTPTVPAANHADDNGRAPINAEPEDAGPDKYDQLTGADLDKAAADADIEGRSNMTADEKRAALRALGA